MSLCVNIVRSGFVAKIAVDAMGAFVKIYLYRSRRWVVVLELLDETKELLLAYFAW
jgi:hypothetical protein